MDFNRDNSASSSVFNSAKLDWAALNSEWESSNESQTVFCKRKNINLNTFTYWRSKFIIKQNKKDERTQLFVPVKIKSENIPTSSPIIIENKFGVKLVIPENVSKNQLTEILKLVGFHPC